MSRITHLKELLRRCCIDNFLNHACFVETVFSAHINSLNRSMIPIIPTVLLCSLLKMLTKDFTDNQIRGLAPAEDACQSVYIGERIFALEIILTPSTKGMYSVPNLGTQ